jgi:glycosyltransferase involved in cell wall biosynthesis
MIEVCAVARGSEVASARVLAASLHRQHPDWRLTVLVLPGLRPPLQPGEEPFQVLFPVALGRPDLEPRLTTDPPEALAALMRPLLAKHVLAEGAERVLVLPPDAELRGPLDELVAQLDAHEVVLTPRLVGHLPEDGRRPDAQDLLEAGELDDSIVALRGELGRRVVAWWAEHAERRHASPLDAAPRVFDGLGTLTDAGYAVSHWNLHERPLGGPPLTAGGRPLRLIRFEGFRADRPWWLSEHATRTLVLDDPLLAELCGTRAQALRDAGWEHESELARQRDVLAHGLVLDARLRRLYAEAIDADEDFGDLESPTGTDAFASWLTAPAPQGASAGVNRYAHDVWRERADVRSAYPDLDGEDGEGFVGWLWVHGRPELRLQEPLLPPPPAWVEVAAHEPPAVLVAGYLRGNLGLGEAGRGYVTALQAAGVPVATRSVSTDPPVDRLPRGARQRPDERPFDDLALPEDRSADAVLLCVNADQVPELTADLGDDARSRYRIGHWAWETDFIPPRWDTAFDLVDEIWVNSTWVAEHIARAGDVPVVVVPTPIVAPDPQGAQVPFELPGGYLFLFVFDFFSTQQRKNPLGLMEAFKRAFAPGEGPSLLLKTINAEFRPQEHERLRYAIGDREDIRLVDVALEPAELAALFVRADCYASLHRAEGYGITLAEAMSLGKPVVATAFSGNLDFMTPRNSYLVDWEPTAVGPDAEHYPEEGTWAEPSVAHAAELLRSVWEDRDEAAGRGARAAADVAAALSPEAVGAIARARLGRIVARRSREPASNGLPWPLEEVEARVGFDLSGVAGGHRGARRLLRRAMFRLIHPYAASERKLDEALVTSLRRLSIELASERAARERDRHRLARLERRLADVARRQD